jgi:AAA+ ATPase superfamily predicted ATPase
MIKQGWSFYGRRDELGQLRRVLDRGRWFFVNVSGRRRIGKTALVQQALQPAQRARVLYLQTPDSDPAGVVSAARDFFQTFGITDKLPVDLRSLATRIGALCASGWIVAIDEFQYFNRRMLFEFTSQLQSEVDRLSARADEVQGGLIVLGSLHTEMAALLEDRQAPLYNRTTDTIELGHLDVGSLLELLDAHAAGGVERLLFLWNLFEGVPKFYRDCYEQGVLAAERHDLLGQMFFSSSSPLRTEADNWFLKELRGRYDLILKYIASHAGCTNADLLAHVNMVDVEHAKQVGGYLKILDERYRMIERRQPVFAKTNAKSGRFYIRDNFLRSWLAALAVPAAATSFRPAQQLIRQADERLAEAEGHGLERLVATLYEERSRKGVGDFSLTHAVRGWWDRSDTEIDLVAVDEEGRRLRLGSCKRSAPRLISDLRRFDGHVARFVQALPRYAGWAVEKVAVAPTLSPAQRAACLDLGYIPQDLGDLTAGLRP